MPSFISTTNCYVVKNNQVLMLHRGAHQPRFPGFWMGPGGVQQAGESVLDTCIRKLKSETGVDGKNFRLRVVATHYYPHNDKVYLVFIFLADYAGGELADSPEGTLEWVDIDRDTKLGRLYPDLKVNLPAALKDSPDVIYTHLVFNERSEIIG